MRNKRGIIGTILLAIILAGFILLGLLYLKIRISGLDFRIGNVVLNIEYSPINNTGNSALNENNETNQTIPVINPTLRNYSENFSENYLIIEDGNVTLNQEGLNTEQ